MAHGKDDGKTDRREKMTGNELAREETQHGNVAQDKMRQEEVVNNKVKITPIPEEEGGRRGRLGSTPQCNVGLEKPCVRRNTESWCEVSGGRRTEHEGDTEDEVMR